MVAGLRRPQRGRIALGERVVFDSARKINLPPQARRVGYVMQDYTLFPHLSVAQNIGYGLRRKKWPKTNVRREVERMLALIQLPDAADHRPHELSGGQQQRVALARALITEPEVLLLDEPFSALDAPTRARLRRDVRAIQQQFGLPALLVTHDLAEASLMADRIAVFEQGQLLQLDSPTEIMHRPASRVVAHLTGTQNCFGGQVTQRTDQTLQIAVGPLQLQTDCRPLAVGQAVSCCIRPEQVILLRPGHRAGQYRNVVNTSVVAVTTDGLSFFLHLKLVEGRLQPQQNHDLEVRLPLHVFERLRPQVGQLWQASIKPSALHLITAD
jgi:molybdate transport system ATP-binding protein